MKTALEWWKYFEDNRNNNPSPFELIEDYALTMDTLKKYISVAEEDHDIEYTIDEMKLVMEIRAEIAKELRGKQ